jgi:hypothetical protein
MFARWDADRASPAETADVHARLQRLVGCCGPVGEKTARPDAANRVGGDQARGVEYGFYRTQPWPDSWGPPEGSPYSQRRLDWIKRHIGGQAEARERLLAKKAGRYLAIARLAELNARRDPWSMGR